MSKPHILLINPNTSETITETVRRLALDEVGNEATVEARTAPFGARYISSHASFAIAGHAVLDAYATTLATSRRPDAVIVGCFGDPGIDGLREVADAPVLGFAESGMLAAIEQPGSFAIATIGAAWQDMLESLARRRGLADRLAGVICIDRWVHDPPAAAMEIERLAQRWNAARLVVGGTGLIPLLPDIARDLTLPVIDPHRRAVRDALRQVNHHTPATAPAAISGQFRGLSPELARMLGHRPADAG